MLTHLFHILFCFSLSAHGQPVVSTKLALNWKPEPQFGGFYAAQVAGHFKQNGLNVEIIPGGAGTPTVQMIAAGKMDFGIVSADEVVMSQSRGGDVVAVFAAYQTNPQGIMVHAERGIASIKDLYSTEGTLAIQKGLPYAMYLEKKYPKPVVQIVPYLGGIANYMSDKKYSQQCFVTSEPLAAEKLGAQTKTFLVAEAGYNPYTTVLVTRGEVLKKNPKLVKAMVDSVRAWERGDEYILQLRAIGEQLRNERHLADRFGIDDRQHTTIGGVGASGLFEKVFDLVDVIAEAGLTAPRKSSAHVSIVP